MFGRDVGTCGVCIVSLFVFILYRMISNSKTAVCVPWIDFLRPFLIGKCYSG